MRFSGYQTEGFYDEMFDPAGQVRPHARLVLEIIESLSDGHLLRYKHAAERLLLQEDAELAKGWMVAYLRGVRDMVRAFDSRQIPDDMVKTILDHGIDVDVVAHGGPGAGI